MLDMHPFFLADFYKVGHPQMQPEGTEFVYSNFTPRSNKYSPTKSDKVVVFGLQAFLKQIVPYFQRNFFDRSKQAVMDEYDQFMQNTIGRIQLCKIAALHDLGYLPLHFKSIEEGKRVNIGIPITTITNTVPGFGWLVQYIETIFLCNSWFPSNSATNI
jgi:nicotinamide phosphoribosyltransferase